MRLKLKTTKARKHTARKKFFNGLYAEYSGLVISEDGYMESSVFMALLEDVKQFMDADVSREQQLYEVGKSFLAVKNKQEERLESVKKLLGEHWKPIRFRNLVRLGADIENAGLGTLSRAVLVGSLIYQKEKLCRVEHAWLDRTY